MNTSFIYRLIPMVAFVALRSMNCEANDGGTLHKFRAITMVFDTVPPPQKPTEEPAKTKVPVIKEVPKSRKHLKPVAIPTVPIRVKPPVKIIRPLIKHLGIIG